MKKYACRKLDSFTKYAAGNSTGMGHTYEEVQYWQWVADVGEETLFVLEEKGRVINGI